MMFKAPIFRPWANRVEKSSSTPKKKIGVLNNQRCGLSVHRSLQAGQVRGAAGVRHDDHVQVQVGGVAVQHPAVDGVDAFVHDHLAPSGLTHGHHHGFVQGRASVVDRGICIVHIQEARDRGLVFEYGLQRTLGSLRLVRGVCRCKLAAGGQEIHGRRDGMVIEPGAQEADQADVVPGGQMLKPTEGLVFLEALRQVEAFGSQGLGYFRKKLLDAGNADGLQHPGLLGRGVGDARHVDSCSARLWMKEKGRRPSHAAGKPPSLLEPGAGHQTLRARTFENVLVRRFVQKTRVTEQKKSMSKPGYSYVRV